MSDDIRTRIAAAIERSLVKQFPPDLPDRYGEWIDNTALADAVIAELERQPPGLQRDGSFIDAAGTVWRHNGQEWTDDRAYRP